MSAQVAERITRLGTEIVNWYLVEVDGRLTAVDAGLPGVSYRQCVESLARIEPLDAALILPGHGEPWSGTPAAAVAHARDAA